ncbi:MAG: transketolase, partial [Chloroflexota bacterium]
MPPIQLIPFEEFERVREARIDRFEQLALIAGMCRANTLAAVKRAGSGHLGSSFSAMDLVVWLYYEQMNTLSIGLDHPDRDIYFSSKGHDVPGQYSVLYSAGVLAEEKLLMLRRLGGLDGHPDVKIPGIEANSGSLGMGISKARGMAWAKRYAGHGGRVYVLLGDGELQEGQNYEALQSTVQQRIGNLTAIVDHNKLQSDKLISQIVDLGDLEAKFRAFGWEVARCDGHDLRAIQAILGEFQSITDRPQLLIADTIKGRGVSFMEHPAALAANNGSYRWHAGAPDDVSFLAAYGELIDTVNQQLESSGLQRLHLRDVTPVASSSSGVSPEFVSAAYGQRLVELAPDHPNL